MGLRCQETGMTLLDRVCELVSTIGDDEGEFDLRIGRNFLWASIIYEDGGSKKFCSVESNADRPKIRNEGVISAEAFRSVALLLVGPSPSLRRAHRRKRLLRGRK